MGWTDARRRDDELQRPDGVIGTERKRQPYERSAAPDRAVHPPRRRHAGILREDRGSADLDAPVDRRIPADAGSRLRDVRIRVPRGQLRDQEHFERIPRHRTVVDQGRNTRIFESSTISSTWTFPPYARDIPTSIAHTRESHRAVISGCTVCATIMRRAPRILSDSASTAQSSSVTFPEN